MTKLADRIEQAFKLLDEGDLKAFTLRIIDTVDYGVQSKKGRQALDGFVDYHFDNRENLLEDVANLIVKKSKEA